MTRPASLDEAEIVVLGGGVIGSAIAWRLTAGARRDVLMIERNEIGGGSSSRAAGLITPLRPSPTSSWFVRQTLAAFDQLDAYAAEPVGFHRVGTLHVAASLETERELMAMTKAADMNGPTYEFLDRGEAERRVPWLSAASARRIAWIGDGGHIDPYLLTQAYARAARAEGARIRTRLAVSRILVQDDRVIGVETDRGCVRCRVLVIAAGAWSGPIAQQIGLPLGMAPVRSHYWITAPDAGLAAEQPVVLLPDAGSYTRPEQNRLVLGAREARSPSYDARGLPADMAEMNLGSEDERWTGLIERRDSLKDFMPGLDALGMTHFVAGLSSYTPDGKQLIGPAPGIGGVFIATGCCGMGIAMSGGFGRLVADMVDARAPEIDPTPYRLDRFGAFEAYHPEFLARCAQARTAKAGVVVKSGEENP